MRERRLAWSLWTLVLVLAALMCLFYVLGLEIPLEDRDRPPLYFLPVMTLLLVVFSTVGALIASHQPRNAVGWIFCAIGVAAGVGFTSQFYGEYTLIAEPGALPGGALAVWVSIWLFVPTLTAITFAGLLFPSGRLLSRRWRGVAWMAAGGGLVGTIALALSPGTLDDRTYPGVENPVGIEGAAGPLDVASSVGDFTGILALLLAAISMVLRFRRSTGVERLQLKWIAYAGGLAAATAVVNLPLTGVDQLSDALFVISFISLLLVPVTAGVAILRYRLYDIDVVINRTLVYGALTATLVTAYLAGVLLLQLALHPVTEESNLAIAGSTLAVAALFRPARAWIQSVVDRRFYRRKYDAAQTLEGFSARLREQVDLDALGDELRSVVTETMQPAHVSIWLRAP